MNFTPFEKLLSEDASKHVLLAGPTASGKSAVALKIAQAFGGLIVNADALQIYSCWNVLTARPPAGDLAQAPHTLYGHVSHDQEYSVGHWLREIEELLKGDQRLIIVGGTGLYFTALTKGLAEIPETGADIRQTADQMTRVDMLADLDARTRSGIDTANRARVQRAWEVLKATGRPIHAWQAETPPPLIPVTDSHAIYLKSDPDWLNQRIEKRFELMMQAGALDEVREVLDIWHDTAPFTKAIGAKELRDYILGVSTLEDAKDRAIIATRQYAKRQRTWFRSKMKSWEIAEIDAN